MKHQHSKLSQITQRRSSKRVKVTITAMGLVPGAERCAECLVHDISNGGARIEFPNADIPPHRFKMHIPELNTLYECITVHVSQNRVGVRFTNTVKLAD